MWTGTSALQNIDQTLQTIRNEVVRLDQNISQLTSTMASKQRHKATLINDIAKVRLLEIERGELEHELTAADHDAAKILVERESALALLSDEIEKLNDKISSAESVREDKLLNVNETSQLIVDRETEVQNSLKHDANYLAQLGKARAAESMAEEANYKAEQAQADMAEKALPYQQDPLFIYLWDRGYATTEYSGGLFSRFMDSWVARIIKYEPARVNYWNLTEIPKRLDEHADSVNAIADEALMALQQLELDALHEAGVKDLETKVEALRELVDQHDDSLENLENTLNAKLENRARFLAGEDDYIDRCIRRLAEALDHQDLRSIHRYVLATNSPTDDQIVIELRGVEDSLADLSSDLADKRLMHGNKISKLKELESVRRNFKNSRFDDVRSGFGNESVIAGMLSQFLQGLVSSGDLWKTIKRNQRYRDVGSLPDFGSGGVGDIGDIFGPSTSRRKSGRRARSQRSSTWHWPAPRRGGGGFNFPRGGSGSRGGGSGSGSGGGFKTGGGF